MDKATERVIVKIQKLLRMSEDETGASPQERETAMRQATALLEKHQLKQTDLGLVEEDQMFGERDVYYIDWEYAQYPHWIMGCYNSCCKLYGCYMVISKSQQQFIVSGRSSHIEIAWALGGYIVNSIIREADKELGHMTGHAATTYQQNKYREDFGTGASVGVDEQIKRLIDSKKERGEGKGMVLLEKVLVDTKEAEALMRAKVQFKQGRRSTARWNSTMEKGREYGGSMSIGNQMADQRRDETLRLK